jgi:hypothetical protein
MRHAGATTGAVGPLVIAVVEAPFGALLMAVPGGAKTAGAACMPTREAAVGVAPITGTTEDEGLSAPLAGPQAEDLHDPVGPEMVGRQWTSSRECCDNSGKPPTPPVGWVRPRARRFQLRALTYSPPGSGHPTRTPTGLPLCIRLGVQIYPGLGERQQGSQIRRTSSPGFISAAPAQCPQQAS